VDWRASYHFLRRSAQNPQLAAAIASQAHHLRRNRYHPNIPFDRQNNGESAIQ
jgi:CRP-like cAMP-binding protein